MTPPIIPTYPNLLDPYTTEIAISRDLARSSQISRAHTIDNQRETPTVTSVTSVTRSLFLHMAYYTIKPPDFADLQKRNLRARVSPLLLLNLTALFSCERVFAPPVRAHSLPPTDVTTPRVTDAPFPLHVRKMRAQTAVRYVRSRHVTKPYCIAASSKLYRALVRYIDPDTRPNLEKIR